MSVNEKVQSTTTWLDYADYANGRDHTVVGNVRVLPDFASPQLGNERDLLVYLPPSYQTSEQRYPVLYMHDGQNLFDNATSYVGEWRVDETMEKLSAEGIEAIVVGIPNSGEQRIAEYNPYSDPRLGAGVGEKYLDFIVETIKPLIDTSFRTLPERDHTAILGSSLGGLISLYAFFHYGEVFGKTGVMSPSLWLAGGATFGYVQKAPKVAGKIYLDVGDREAGGRMRDSARRMWHLLQKRGYREGRDLLYVEEKDGVHNEEHWAARLPHALRFLLK